MSQEITGRAFKNVSGSPILITDVATIEIPPDGTISLVDYPILERSTHLRKFISLNYLIEDPARGALVGPAAKVTMQSVPAAAQQRELSEAEIFRIADRVAKALVPTLDRIGTTAATPSVQDAPDRRSEKPDWDADRADIIDRAIRTIGPTTENFGELPDAAPGDQVDVDKLVGGLRSVVEHVEPPKGSV